MPPLPSASGQNQALANDAAAYQSLLAQGLYFASMSLYPYFSIPQHADPAEVQELAQQGIETRFDQALKRKWSALVYPASIESTGLATKLNTLLFDAKSAAMSVDLGGVSVYSARSPTGDNPWTPGGGGFHESRAAVQARTGTLMPYPWDDWTFNISVASTEIVPPGNPKPAPIIVPVTVFAYVRWLKVPLSI